MFYNLILFFLTHTVLTISLHLKVCNSVFCRNRTFHNWLSIYSFHKLPEVLWITFALISFYLKIPLGITFLTLHSFFQDPFCLGNSSKLLLHSKKENIDQLLNMFLLLLNIDYTCTLLANISWPETIASYWEHLVVNTRRNFMAISWFGNSV